MTTPIELIINGKDNTGGAFASAGGGLAKIGSIAGGIIASQVFTSLARAISGAASEALQSYANYERLGMSLTSMAAREMINADSSLSMAEAMGKAKGVAAELQGWRQH